MINRTFDLVEYISINYPKKDILAGKKNGKWIKYSTTEYVDYAHCISLGLVSLGLMPGDRIAIISNNRPEWNFVDMGISKAGMISVPIYPTISAEEYTYILNHAEPRLVFISDKSLYQKLLPVLDKTKSIKDVYTFNEISECRNWLELVELGRVNQLKLKVQLENIGLSIYPNDVFTIIYTSGTTGVPKGVMLTHANIISNFITTSHVHSFGKEHKALSFLPLCHIYERMLHYHLQYKGISVYYAENISTIADNLKEVQPQIMSTVPRLLESIYAKILTKGEELPFILKQVFLWAVRLALKFNDTTKNNWWYLLRLKLADVLVFKKWRQALGTNLKIIVSGGAALQPRLARSFWAAGISVLEGYGLTETSPVIAVNNLTRKEIKIGTVGPLIDGVQVKISEDGEILCKGPNVMKGYYKDPDLTKEVIDIDGWFHTGDVGCIEDNKFLKITDRKKEIFKLSSGKYIAPQSIENKLKESLFIDQVMVIGENEKFASAIISPNFQHLHHWSYHHKIDFRDNLELISTNQILSVFQKEVDLINKEIGLTEQIKRFRLVCEEWKPDTGELSQTLKLKRNFLLAKYKDLIDDIYSTDRKQDDSIALFGMIKTGLGNIRKVGVRVGNILKR